MILLLHRDRQHVYSNTVDLATDMEGLARKFELWACNLADGRQRRRPIELQDLGAVWGEGQVWLGGYIH